MEKHKKNQMSGITLIALVVTIIVLLILAGISIQMLSGDNGILQRATEAKTRTERQSIVEQARTDVLGYQAYNKSGDLNKAQLKSVLDKYFDQVPDLTDMEKNAILNTELKTLPKYGTHTIKVSEIYVGNLSEQVDTGIVKIAYTLQKNTIIINFEPNSLYLYIDSMSIEKKEELLLTLSKALWSDYYAEEYPGEEISLSLVYNDWGYSSISEAVSNEGFDTDVDMFLDRFGEENICRVLGMEETITGTITLKKGDTVIKQGEVSKDNDLEYSLTSLGAYTIIGETSDGIKCTKTFEPELDMESFTIGPVRDEWSYKTFQVTVGSTLEQWIEQEHPDHFVVSNGYVYYDEYNPGVYDYRTVICQGFREVSATSIIHSEHYTVGID